MTLLAIDVGNSRVKWGLHDGSNWTVSGAVDHSQRAALAAAWAHLPRISRAIGSNVAGLDARASVEVALAAHELNVRWIESRSAECGVRNLYRDPAQLGSDRWAALIAARSMNAGACLVVNAGTAVTVDALSAAGEFLGGLIVPGLRLMHEALARDTFRLGRDAGSYAIFPRSTADAIASGAINAVVGAVERILDRLRDNGDSPAAIIASGGAIDALRPHLPLDVQVVDNLVLRGLLAIAEE